MSMPAAFNGVFSIKPSSGRISFKTAPNSVSTSMILLACMRINIRRRVQSPGQQVIPTVAGIMGTSISCLQLTLRALQSAQPWLYDPDVVDLPWRYEKEVLAGTDSAKAVTFGVLPSDGVVTPHPPIQRAIRTVVSALTAAGYEVGPALTHECMQS